MKRISTFLSVMFVGGALMAQNPLKHNNGVAFTDSKLKAPDADRVVSINKKSSAAAGCGSVIYSFDFAGGIPTGWANFGTPSAATWEYRGPGTSPDITVGSRGAYAGGTSAIASSSASNGFMIFDSDFLDSNGDPATMGQGAAPAPHVGVLATSPLDFSSYNNVTISLESYARTFYGQQWLIFSNDGGVSFSDSIQLHTDLAVNASSDNPVLYTLNISSIVAGESNVVVGFLFDGTPGNANGNGYYFWQFDDVAFLETPDFDLAIADWGIAQGTKRGVYGSTPINEVSEHIVSIISENKGAASVNATTLEVETFDLNGSANLSTTNAGVLASSATMQIDENTGFTPMDTGFYDVAIRLLGDSTDCFPVDNTQDYSFYVSEEEGVYALDHGNINSYLGTNSFTGGEDGFQMLNVYEFQDTFYLKNVWMRVSALTTEGATGYIVVYDSTGATVGGGGQFANQQQPLYKSQEYTFTALDGPNGFVTIPCNFKIPPGGYYIGLEAYSGGNVDTVRIAIDESVPQTPIASLIYILNTGLYTNPDAFLLRLNQTNCSGVNISISGNVTDNETIGKIDNVQIVGGEPPYAIQWTGPNLFTSQAQNLNAVTVQGNYTISVVDRNGCDATNTFTVAGIVSANEINNASSFEVFPNPSEGLFNLNFNNIDAGTYAIEVRNMVGQIVYNGSVQVGNNGNSVLDLSELSKGAYILNVSGEKVELNKSIVVK